MIRRTTSHLEIGAAVTLTDAFALLNQEFPLLAEGWTRFASVPIRNSGTLGGNIANGSPIGDSMPALIALGASVLLRRGDTQRELPLESFYIDYQKTALASGEFVAQVRVPRAPAGNDIRGVQGVEAFRPGYFRGLRLYSYAARCRVACRKLRIGWAAWRRFPSAR